MKKIFGAAGVWLKIRGGVRPYVPLLANISATLIFSFAYLFTSVGLKVVGYDAVKFLAFRFTLGFIILSLLLVTGFQKVDYRKKPFRLLLLCGLLNPCVSQVLETSAIAYAPTSQMAVMFSVLPVCVVVLSIFINRERPTKRQALFMSFSVAGVLLVNLVDGQMEGGTVQGIIIITGAIFVISLQRVYIRRASGSFTAFETIYVTTGMGAVSFSAATLLTHASGGRLGNFFDGLLTPDFIIPILYMGIMSCVVAFLFFTYAAGRLPIAVANSTGMAGTIITVSVGVFVLHEKFRLIDVVGTAVILFGIVGVVLNYDAHVSNRYNLRNKN